MLLHGAGGLGKSCLAGKLCERFTDHTLIIVYGRVNDSRLKAALNDAFIRANDENGLQILNVEKEMPEKLSRLCANSFKEKNYLFLFDDFEQNLEGAAEGKPGALIAETVPILKTLLHYLPGAGKMTQLLITSHYPFSLTENAQDLAKERLKWLSLRSFQSAEQAKKARGLSHIWNYSDSEIAKQLLAAGRGNPRLMEWLDKLVGTMPDAEVADLLAAVRDKQEEFIQKHVIRELLRHAGEPVERFLRCFSVYRLPVAAHGAERIMQSVLGSEQNWQGLLEQGVRLSLVEHDRDHSTYWITPLLREELWAGLNAEERHACHEAAFAYYEKICGGRDGIDPALTEEWIYHALGCGREDVATREGGGLISCLRENLAYRESKRIGEWILSKRQQPLLTQNDLSFLFAFSYVLMDLGEPARAMEYMTQAMKILPNTPTELDLTPFDLSTFEQVASDSSQSSNGIKEYEQALTISRTVYGDDHPEVAVALNNLGSAWITLGECQKAIACFEQALSIDRALYGEKHPKIAAEFGNLGKAWATLGYHQKAIECHERALNIYRLLFDKNHPLVAVEMQSLATLWEKIGKLEKAVEYYEQAIEIGLSIITKNHPQFDVAIDNFAKTFENSPLSKYAEQLAAHVKENNALLHPQIASTLKNAGLQFHKLGGNEEAISYFEKALTANRAVYGEDHPIIAQELNNLAAACKLLTNYEKALYYYEQALLINKKIYGEQHQDVAVSLINLGTMYYELGQKEQAKKYFQEAYAICYQLSGPEHPHTKTVAEWLAKFE